MSKSQPLLKGSLVLQEKPFAYIVKSKFSKERCDFCLSSGKLMKCSGCNHSHYCGVLCQRDAWAEHKYECLCMKKIAPRTIPDAARIIARIVWKLQYGGYLQKSNYSRNGFRKFIDLMPHLTDIKWDKQRMEHAESLYAILHEYLAPEHVPNQTEFLGIYGRLCINGFNLLDDEMNSIGTAIYLAASIIDHSCQPNAVATFNGPEISIRLLEDMPSLDWSKIRISYIDALNLTNDRQTELEKAYYFECDCSRCKDTQQNDRMLAAACPNKRRECNAYVKRGAIQCGTCGTDLDVEFWEKYEEVLQLTKDKLEEMLEIRYVDVCIVLDKQQQKVLHPENIYRLKTMDMAFEAAIDFQRWPEAIEFGKQLIPGLKNHTFTQNPLIGIVRMKMGKIHLLLGDYQMAIHECREAVDLLKITHGESSRLMRDKLMPLYVNAQECMAEAQRLLAEQEEEDDEENEEEQQ